LIIDSSELISILS